MKSLQKKNQGFSLIEMIIAIAIMAILTGVLAPQVMRYIEKSREARDLQIMDTVYEAVEMAVMDEDAYSDLIAHSGSGSTYSGIESDGLSFSKLQEAAKTSSNLFAVEVMSILGTKAKAELNSRSAGGPGAEPVIQMKVDGQKGMLSLTVFSSGNKKVGVGEGVE